MLHLTLLIFPVVSSIFGCVHVFKQERETDTEQVEEVEEEEASVSHLQRLGITVTKLFQLNQAIRQLHSSLSTALRGETSVTTYPLYLTLYSTEMYLLFQSSRRNSMSRANAVRSCFLPFTFSFYKDVLNVHSIIQLRSNFRKKQIRRSSLLHDCRKMFCILISITHNERIKNVALASEYVVLHEPSMYNELLCCDS